MEEMRKTGWKIDMTGVTKSLESPRTWWQTTFMCVEYFFFTTTLWASCGEQLFSSSINVWLCCCSWWKWQKKQVGSFSHIWTYLQVENLCLSTFICVLSFTEVKARIKWGLQRQTFICLSQPSDVHINEKMTGEAPDVRSDKRNLV